MTAQVAKNEKKKTTFSILGIENTVYLNSTNKTERKVPLDQSKLKVLR